MLPKRQIQYLYESLGSRIKRLREEKGYKQAPFADLLKISRASLVNIERGRQHPPLHNLYEIARLLDTSLCELLPDLHDTPENLINPNIEKAIQLSSAGNEEIKEKLRVFINFNKSIRNNE